MTPRSYMRSQYPKHVFFLAIFISITISCSCFCSSPRVLVTLGPRCDFTCQDLHQAAGGNLITGSDKEMKEKIIEIDRTEPNHLMILEHALNGMKEFSHKIGYATFTLNISFKNAIRQLNKTLSTIPAIDADLPHLPPQDVGLFYDLMSKANNIFKEHQLPYWATCGTLLGIVRHQGMIPWDDDIDIAIFEKDVPRLLELVEALTAVGIKLAYYAKYDFYKIYFEKGEPIAEADGSFYPWTYPNIDILPLTLIEERYTYRGEPWQKDYKDIDFYTQGDLHFPLPEMPFGPLLLPVCHHPIEYILRMYGDDWYEVAYVNYSHKHEKFLEKIKVDLIDHSPPHYILPQFIE